MPTYHTQDHAICGTLAPITPHDNNDLAPCFVYVGVGGDLTVIAAGNQNDSPPPTPVLLRNVPTGSLLPIKVTRVKNSGTTATGLVACR